MGIAGDTAVAESEIARIVVDRRRIARRVGEPAGEITDVQAEEVRP